MKKVAAIVLFSVTLFLVACSSRSQINNPEEQLLKISEESLSDVPILQGRTFSVYVDEEKIYHVDINGYELKAEKCAEDEQNKIQVSKCKKPNPEIKGIVEKSKKMVINYIDKSKILRDKDILVDYITEIEVQVAKFSNLDAPAFYDDITDKVYINKKYKNVACECMVVHELIHALCQKTNGGIENEKYAYSRFNEVMTDVIAMSMKPKMPAGYVSGYVYYWIYAYEFIGALGEDALIGYFYGYDKIDIEPYELDVFALSMAGANENQNLLVMVNNCINSWRAQREMGDKE